MVFFNDPIPCDDPARRAIALALGMRSRTGALSDEWKRRGHQLTLGVGVAAGYATCGQIGFEGRFDYTAIGSAVNLSARLCGDRTSDAPPSRRARELARRRARTSPCRWRDATFSSVRAHRPLNTRAWVRLAGARAHGQARSEPNDPRSVVRARFGGDLGAAATAHDGAGLRPELVASEHTPNECREL